MPFSDLIRASVTVDSGKRTITCRRPTLATIWRLYQYFGGEIRNAIDAKTLQEIASQDVARSLIIELMMARPADARAVLSTCVDLVPTSDRETMACLAAVLVMTDVYRIAGVIASGDSGHEALRRPDSKSDSTVNLAVEVAKFVQLDPFVIANEWPYEAVLTVLDDMADRAMAASEEKTFKALPGTPIGPGFGSARVINKRPLVN